MFVFTFFKKCGIMYAHGLTWGWLGFDGNNRA